MLSAGGYGRLGAVGRAGALLLTSLLFAAGVAQAEEAPPSDTAPAGAAPGVRTHAAEEERARSAEAEGARDSGEPPTSPRWLRLELAGRVAGPLIGKLKRGVAAETRGLDFQKDAHLPLDPTYGLSAHVDVALASWCSLGATYTGITARGPTTSIHHRGVELDGQAFPGRSRVRTTIDLQYLELSLRYVWINRPTIRLWFGIGPAYAHLRVRLEGEGERARATVQALLGPALTYELSARVGVVTLFLTNGITLAVDHRLPSFVSTSRLGARWHVLGDSLELVTAISAVNGLLTDWNEQFRRDHLTEGHEWRRARWSNIGLEIGVAVTF